MKKLYLLRHADASLTAGEDIERELSNEGHIEAEILAKSINKLKPHCDVVLCSNAIRARETYAHIENVLGSNPVQYLDKLYYADTEAMLKILRSLPDSNMSALIISHNPTLSDIATYLTGSEIHFKTGILKSLEINVESWQNIIAPSCAKLAWSLPN